MKTKITFKALKDGNVVYKNIDIEHSFKVKPCEYFNGYKLPQESIESQVIDYLDEIDKTEIMQKNGFDIILDYYPYKKGTKKNEIKDFLLFCEPYLQKFPNLRRPFSAIIHESQNTLFGKHKSNTTKIKEVLNGVSIANKAALGTLEALNNILNIELKKIN